MASNDCNDRDPAPITTKIIIAGGFGAGKTTLIGAVSEIVPLATEEIITAESLGTDDLTGIETKATTTVAFDFGRITLDGLVVYLFGTPGQHRFWFMWDELAAGALGAAVLADTRRLADCFAAVDYFEGHGLPFVLAVNRFDGAPAYTTEEVRDACGLAHTVPVVDCDARHRPSAASVLITLTRHLLAAASPPGDPLPDDPIVAIGARDDL